jgi:glycosyltransferase involved in cell wall biosynthesis
VIFTGYVDNLWELMKRANAFVSLSRCEGCPNVVLEAMACECPLIVSDIPAHREMLAEKEALFVKLDDPEAAARAILSTLTDTAATQARAESAGANVNQRPSLEVAARKHEAAYREMIESRGALLRRFAKRPRPEWKFPAEQGEP